MTTNFNHLQANLSEIYAALDSQRNQEEPLPLFATSHSSVNYEGSWMGKMVKRWDKIWRWIQPEHDSPILDHTLQFILKTLFNQAVCQAYDVRQKRIWNHIQQIEQIWKGDAERQRVRYFQFLTFELKKSTQSIQSLQLTSFDQRKSELLSANEEKELRHTIVNFHQATYVFWSLFFMNDDRAVRMRFPLLRHVDSSSLLIDHSFFKALKNEGRWIQLEGVMHQTIPVALFAKLHDRSSLKVEENSRLTSWVQTLNNCGKGITPHLLYKILIEIMNVIELQGSSPMKLKDLLLWLDQQGCSLLHQEDAAHMDWREQLCKGAAIECNGKKLILGRQLSPYKEIDDTYKIFQLADYPDYVVKIAHNRFLLLLEDQLRLSEQQHWGIRLVGVIENLEEDSLKPPIPGLDRLGRCVVLEKLSSPFDQHVWRSQETELVGQDERVALVLANHLFCLSNWKGSIQNLNNSDLMWDNKGILKSTRLLKRNAADYLAWETCSEMFAKGNPYVLSFLMNVSKLNKHPIAIYYRNVVGHTLKKGKIDLIGHPLPLGYRQDHYNRHAEALCTKAQELRKFCLQSVAAHLRRGNRYSYHQENQLQEAIGNRLCELYYQSPMPGRFSSKLQDEVVVSFTSIKKEYSLNSFDEKSYYEEKHELILKYNRALLRSSTKI